MERLLVPWLFVGTEDDAAPVLGEEAGRDGARVAVPRPMDFYGPLNDAASIHVLAAKYQRIPVLSESKSKY